MVKPIIDPQREGHKDTIYNADDDICHIEEKTEIRHSTQDIANHTLKCLSRMKHSIIGCFDSAGPP